MKIEELLKLQEENKLPVRIGNSLRQVEILAVNQKIALTRSYYIHTRHLGGFELVPETIHIEAYAHFLEDGTLALSKSAILLLPEVVKTIDLSRDVEKTW